MLYAYSQIATGVFKQSLRTYVRSVKVTEVTETDIAGKEQIHPGFEYTQGKYQCRLVNGGSDTCAMDFTWKDGKFTYFGFGKSDDAAATTEQALPPDAPVTQ